jgi:hypothetical protein
MESTTAAERRNAGDVVAATGVCCPQAKTSDRARATQKDLAIDVVTHELPFHRVRTTIVMARSGRGEMPHSTLVLSFARSQLKSLKLVRRNL